jgi:hypothetical protein
MSIEWKSVELSSFRHSNFCHHAKLSKEKRGEFLAHILSQLHKEVGDGSLGHPVKGSGHCE